MAEEKSVRKRFDFKEFFFQWEFILVIILIGIFIMNSSLSPNFLRVQTFLNAPMSFLDKAFMVLPMTFVLLLGKIDISVGSTVALSAVALGLSYQAGLPMILAIMVALLVGTLAGFINGFLITRYHELPSMILTLGTLTLYRGLSYILLENQSISGFPDWFQTLGWGYIGSVPIMFIVFALFAAFFIILMHKTAFGREISAIGFNERTSKYSGIKVNKRIIITFTMMGFMAAVTALFLASRMSSVRADIAVGYELEVIAMVVLGGVSTSGGVGKMVGPVIAVFIIGFLRYGLGLINVSSQVITMIIGVLLIGSVLVTKFKINRK